MKKEINELMDIIDNDYGGHSGLSMGYTMRNLQFIAYFGLKRYLKVKKIVDEN